MHDQLESLHKSLAGQTDSVDDLFAGVAEVRLKERPAKDSWSAVEHLEHLSIVNELYLDRLEPAIESARAAGVLGRGPYGGGWLGEKLIASQAPPPKWKIRTFKRAKPQTHLEVGPVIERFRLLQDRCQLVLVNSDGVDLGAAQFRSPLFGLLKLSAIQGFRLIKAHNSRHIWHIQRTVSA